MRRIALFWLALLSSAEAQQIVWLGGLNAVESEASALTPDAQIVLGSLRLSKPICLPCCSPLDRQG